MKLNSYYTLSGTRFITVDRFDSKKKGDVIKLNINDQVTTWKIIVIDIVSNFKKYHLTDHQLIGFSDAESDYFMILEK